MICEKCGSQNIDGVKFCTGCNSPMPPVSGCGGFGDILDFESINATPTVAATSPVVVQGGYNEEDMRNLLRKTDSVIRQTDRNGRLSLIAIFVSLAAIVCTVVMGVSIISMVEEQNAKIDKLIASTEEEVANDIEAFAKDATSEVVVPDETIEIVE